MNITISAREHATILAALRVYQVRLELNGGMPPKDFEDIASNMGEHDPMGPLEIDPLCERLNLTDASESNDGPNLDEFVEACGDLKLFGGDGGYEAEDRAKAAYDAITE